MTLLSVEDLCIDAVEQGGASRHAIVRDVGFELGRGEILALVGESGSGKSMTALSIMGLLPGPGVQRISGRIEFAGRTVSEFSRRELEHIRGSGIGMIFQEPMSALNPVFSIGEQVSEVVRRHHGLSGREARHRAISLLERVGLPDPAARYDEPPHRFSGGMRQRVMIAMAIAGNPTVLIADEPTTALDVRTQRGVLDLLQSLVSEAGMGLLLISHDMALVGERADRVCVLCRGRICELGPTSEVLRSPLHPYTRGLIRCTPGLHQGRVSLAEMAAALEQPDLGPLRTDGSASGKRPWWPSEGDRSEWRLLDAGTGRFVAVSDR
ncbi:MAG TPA: ABC transporter ATP-binding protein [Phycisphaerales bacterium]|nr:ABC transporter ATP-binding protein [Phycisphaerales bacterium]